MQSDVTPDSRLQVGCVLDCGGGADSAPLTASSVAGLQRPVWPARPSAMPILGDHESPNFNFASFSGCTTYAPGAFRRTQAAKTGYPFCTVGCTPKSPRSPHGAT